MAGIREAGGAEVPLSPEEIVRVADVLVDRIIAFPPGVAGQRADTAGYMGSASLKPAARAEIGIKQSWAARPGEGAGSAVAGAVGVLVAPRLAAKLITSPAFVKWLTTPITSSTGISAHLGRLVGIAVAEPELREAIDQYTAALRSVPAQ